MPILKQINGIVPASKWKAKRLLMNIHIFIKTRIIVFENGFRESVRVNHHHHHHFIQWKEDDHKEETTFSKIASFRCRRLMHKRFSNSEQ